MKGKLLSTLKVTRRAAACVLSGAILACLSAGRSVAHDLGQGGSAEPSSVARPIVIAHRGASGHRPEHTLAAYQLAIEMGADFIEPDLVSTSDRVLVARHENEISGTTDVADHPEFAGRRTRKTIDGVPVTGWFTENFTLAELKTLRAKERVPQLRPQNVAFNGLYPIPTLQEVIDLAKSLGAARGRTIGIYPETKHPTYFDSIGLSLEEPLVQILHQNGYRSASSPIFIQSFEVSNLVDLRGMTRLPIAQLLNDVGAPYDFIARKIAVTYADMATPAGLARIAGYANGIGANKNLIVPRNAGSALSRPTTLVRDAHAAGLLVHAWTFRSENSFLPTDFRKGNPADSAYPAQHGRIEGEIKLFLDLGLDGFFTDFPDTGVTVRDRLFPQSQRPQGSRRGKGLLRPSGAHGCDATFPAA